jgi:hypothetical protein
MGLPRISHSITGFNADIATTNDYLLKIIPPATTPTWQRLGLTAAELAQWQLFQSTWQPLFIKYSDKKGQRTTDVKDQLKQIIKNTIAYDHKQHLFDRIAINANAVNSDFEIFRIKRGTALADTSITRAAVPGTKEEVITLRQSKHFMHQLLVTSSAGKKGRGKEKGVKDVLIYKAVTGPKDGAPALSQYQYIGDVKRGLITVLHADTDEGNKAWYIARIKNTRSEIGAPSAALGVLIM